MSHPISRGLECPKYARLISKNLASKKNATSLVWNYFGLPATEDGDLVTKNMAICQLCKYPVSSKGGSTTNLNVHIKNHHAKEYATMNGNRSTSSSVVVNMDASNSVGDAHIYDPTAGTCEMPFSDTENPMFTSLASTSEKQNGKWEFTPLASVMPEKQRAAAVQSTVPAIQPCNIVECNIDETIHTNLSVEISEIDPSTLPSTTSEKQGAVTKFLATAMQPCRFIECNVNSATAEISGLPPRKRQRTILEPTPLASAFEKQCTATVTKFIATTMQSYSIVEWTPFVELVKTLNPKYKLPGRKYISNSAIPKLYLDTKEKIKCELASIKDNDVSLTIDCWTSANSIPFITITAHFIDNTWELRSACLNCVNFEIDHTAETIKEKLSKWNLDINMLCSCTTDNGSNLQMAIAFFNVQHVPCFGHTISVGINRALQISILRKAIYKMTKLQNLISNVHNVSIGLRKAQESLQMKPVKLPNACPHHWGSTLKLCKTFLQNQLPLCKLKEDYPAKKLLELDKNELSALEDFVESMRLIEDVTKSLSGDKYTIASSIIPLLRKIKKNLQDKEADRQLVKEIKKAILSALEDHYFKRNKLMQVLTFATICDPRFRLNYIENKEEVKKLVLSKMLDIYEHNVNMPKKTVNDITEKHGLAKLLDSDDENEEPITVNGILLPNTKAENELENYLSMPKVALNADPLNWWQSHEVSFPSLKLLAKKFLAVQGTSVPSERIFSSGRSVICMNRTSLQPKTAEMQVFLAQNTSFI